MSRRKAILLALKTRCQAITIANGFRTNAGQHVSLHEMRVYGDASDPVAQIALVVGQEPEITWQGDKVSIDLPVNVQAIVKADVDEPWEALEDVIADIKEAIELEDRRLGGLVRADIERGGVQSLEREPGSLYVGAQVPYVITYTEGWGRPEAEA